MKVSLRLAYRSTAQRATTAIFVAGAGPEEWLRQVENWKVAQGSLRFLPICGAPGGGLSDGVLVLVPKEEKAIGTIEGVAYGQIGERFYLPVESVLEPGLDARELEKLLNELPGQEKKAIFVWSPARGLLRFAPGDVLRMVGLLGAPEVVRGGWAAPPMGEMRPEKLIELAPREIPDLKTILEQGRDGIGGLAGERGIDTPSPKESGAVTRGMQSVAGAAAGAIAKTPFLPQSWAQALQQWAKDLMQRSADSLSAMRNREMARLMNLLEKNPDEGLQYAIPLKPNQAPRGVAPPGGNLVRRDVNFSSWGMGTGAGDPWDIAQYEADLRKRYHALAQREIQLGRFRRAAYIYAELLGQLELAATTLEQGGDYREAAVLYEKRLNRPQQAADCYLRGGLWTEAIRLLEQLGQHERVGDTYTKIGEIERARRAYELAFGQRRHANDYLDAVRILETKLLDLDGAIELSIQGWPDTAQAKACLLKHFELLEHAGRHEETARRLKSEAGAKIVPRRQLDLMDAMSHMAQRYPDAEVRATAKDRTRFLASLLFKEKWQSATEEIVSAVRRLEPNEVVLGRDCQRYLTQVGRAPKTSMSNIVSKALLGGVAQKITLPADVQWVSAISSGKFFYAAGWKDGKLVVLRGAWSGLWQLIPRPWVTNTPPGPILLAVEPVAARKASLFVHPILSGAELEAQSFPIGSGDFAFTQSVGGAKIFTPKTVAIGFVRGATMMVVDLFDQEHFVVKHFTLQSQQLIESAVIFGNEESFETPPSSVVAGNLYLALGKEILNASHVQQDRLQTYLPIDRLAGGRRDGRNLLIALHEQGASIFGGRANENAYVEADMKEPVACVTTCGACVVASREGIRAYDFTNQGLKLLWKHDGLDSKPIAALSTGVARQFGLLLENGEMRVFSIGR